MLRLEVNNLHVEIDGKKSLNGLDLTIEKRNVHAIMGPNDGQVDARAIKTASAAKELIAIAASFYLVSCFKEPH